MTWEVRAENDCLWITCRGSYDLEGVKTVGSSAYKWAAEHGVHKVLIDWRELTGTATDTDRYETGKFVAEAYARQDPVRLVRVAVVGNEPIISKDRIGQTVARNRGAHGIVTTDFAEALAYLELDPLPEN
jgi:hypothetical protein